MQQLSMRNEWIVVGMGNSVCVREGTTILITRMLNGAVWHSGCGASLVTHELPSLCRPTMQSFTDSLFSYYDNSNENKDNDKSNNIVHKNYNYGNKNDTDANHNAFSSICRFLFGLLSVIRTKIPSHFR